MVLIASSLKKTKNSVAFNLILEEFCRGVPIQCIVFYWSAGLVVSDPTPEVEASQSLLAHAKAKLGDTISMVGKRLVSEKEWQAIQQEV